MLGSGTAFLTMDSISTILNPSPLNSTILKLSSFASKNIIIVEFNDDLASSDLILHHPASLPELLNSYYSTLRSILNKQAPLITTLSKPHKPTFWYTPA